MSNSSATNNNSTNCTNSPPQISECPENIQEKWLDSRLFVPFKNDLDCPSIASLRPPRIRYLSTFLCRTEHAHNDSNSACPSPRICSDICQTFLFTLSAAFSNPEICSQTLNVSATQTRVRLIQRLNQECSATLPCGNAVPSEENNCGFGNTDEGIEAAKYWCSVASQDTCCSKELRLVQFSSSSSSSTPSPNVPSNTDSVGNGSSGALSPGAIAGIVIASLIVFVIFIFIGWFIYTRKWRALSLLSPKRASFSSHLGFTADEVKKRFQDGALSSASYSSKSPRQSSLLSSDPASASPAHSSAVVIENVTYETFAIQDYTALNKDELTLHVGDRICVQSVFDDGWGYGENLSSSERGVFPVVCLGSI